MLKQEKKHVVIHHIVRASQKFGLSINNFIIGNSIVNSQCLISGLNHPEDYFISCQFVSQLLVISVISFPSFSAMLPHERFQDSSLIHYSQPLLKPCIILHYLCNTTHFNTHFLPHSRCSTLNFQFCENMVQLLFFSFVIVHFPLSLLKCLLPSHLSGKMLCFHQETAQTQSLFCSYFHTSPSSSFLCPELIINPSFSLCLRYLYHKTHNAILS